MKANKSEHKKLYFKGNELTDLFIKKNDNSRGKSTLFGISGEKIHINHIIDAQNKISVHTTTRSEGGVATRKNILPSNEAKISIETLAKDVEEKIMKKEYLGDDLAYFDMQILEKIVAELIVPKEKNAHTELVDIGENFNRIGKIFEENQDKILTKIQRKDIANYEGKVLINKDKCPLFVYKGKIYEVENFQKDFYSGYSGAFFGFSGIDFTKVEEKIKEKTGSTT